ncbi:MAG: tetratricopeptide repeat protein [PVC group bacterium]|nr:tetratricopeptide repeat protein [PVC group bacterium]
MLRQFICAMFIISLFLCPIVQAQEKEEIIGTTNASLVGAIEQNNWKKALEISRRVSTDHPENEMAAYVADLAADVLEDRTQIQLTGFDFPFSDPAALKSLRSWAETTLSKFPKSANIIILNGMLASPKAGGDIEIFVEYFEKAAAIAPKNVYILAGLGSAYGAQGKLDRAVQTLEKAIAIRPTSAAHTNLGVAFLLQNKISEAEVHLKKAIELDDQDSAAWFNFGSYYLGLGRMQDAKQPLETAVSLAPKNLNARWNLGGVYFNTKQKILAIGQLKEMIKIAPESPMGKQAQQMMSQLGE